jgi:D-alanyl-D-alanine carboxypeptidase/D-alanyl-D-alanine-endopeptidase (penicillin-binding protein 4)
MLGFLEIKRIFTILILLFVHSNAAANLAARLETQVKQAGFKKDEIGIWISDGATVIYSHHSDKKFIPASLSKIPTAAATLSLLPQGHKFKTHLVASKVGAGVGKNLRVTSGTLSGPLYLVGGGDPGFVSETAWFLVNELTRTGVKTIEGDLIVDDTRFDAIRFGEDRQSQRVDRAYDAPLGAMSLNWNSITAFIRPGSEVGSPAEVVLDVESPFVKLQNKTKTVQAGKGFNVSVERLKSENPEAGEVFLATGTIAADHPEKPVYKSIREPAIFSAQSLRIFLSARGIQLKGSVKIGQIPQPLSEMTILATAESKPLPLIVADMMKWSNNYVADMLVKNLSAEQSGSQGNIADGTKRIRDYLEKTVGLKPGSYEFINGAGFTRDNSLSPAQLGSILTSVRNDFRIFPEFLSSLPIAGVDGTLRSRFRGLDGVGWVRAKSGLLNGTIGLAGYTGDDRGRIFTFVFLFNGSSGKEDSARSLFDRLATTLVKNL